MAFHEIKTVLLTTALVTSAAFASTAAAQAHSPGWRKGCCPRYETPVYAAPVVYAYAQRPWVWSADGWRYPAPATPPGAALLGVGPLGF